MYTRGGDGGETGLYGSRRVSKDSKRVEAYGTIDELNSCLGIAASISNLDGASRALKEIQKLLLVAGADLASDSPGGGERDRVPRVTKEDIQRLEKMIDDLQTKVPKLERFIIPGGGKLAAQLHFARAVCRRAERRVVALANEEKINPEMIPFLNRLSTYLFDMARHANAMEGRADELWER